MNATDVHRVKSSLALCVRRDRYLNAFKPGGMRYFPDSKPPNLNGVLFVNNLYMATKAFPPPPVICKAAWLLDPVSETDCEHDVSQSIDMLGSRPGAASDHVFVDSDYFDPTAFKNRDTFFCSSSSDEEDGGQDNDGKQHHCTEIYIP